MFLKGWKTSLPTKHSAHDGPLQMRITARWPNGSERNVLISTACAKRYVKSSFRQYSVESRSLLFTFTSIVNNSSHGTSLWIRPQGRTARARRGRRSEEGPRRSRSFGSSIAPRPRTRRQPPVCSETPLGAAPRVRLRTVGPCPLRADDCDRDAFDPAKFSSTALAPIVWLD